MKIITGEKELLGSKTFIALGLGETEISIDDGPESLRFIFNFVESADEKVAGPKLEAVDGQTLKITLANWNNPLGITLNEPLEIGTYRHRVLFVLFFVKKAGQEGQFREVTFSLYLGEEVQGGHN